MDAVRTYLRRMWAPLGASPIQGVEALAADIDKVMRLRSCVEASDQWEEYWTCCPVCQECFDLEEGFIFHKNRAPIN